MSTSMPSRAAQDRADADMIEGDIPVMKLPLAKRKELRAQVKGVMEEADLDDTYGKDSR